MVVTVFGGSQYLSDIIVRNPSTVYWLMESSTWAAPDNRRQLHRMVRPRGGHVPVHPRPRLDAVRRAHRRALLKIGILDLEQGEPVEDIASRLSQLADAVAAVVLRVVCEGRRRRDGHGGAASPSSPWGNSVAVS